MPGRWTRKPPYGTPIDRSHPLAQGLVALWPLNEGAGVPWDAAATFPAASNGAVWGPTPHGIGLSLSGSSPQYVSLGSSTPWLNVTGPVTVMTLASPASGALATIVDGHQTAGNFGYLLSVNNSSTNEINAFANGTTINSSANAVDGNWHVFGHSQSSTAAGGVAFFRDGQPWGTGTLASFPTSWTGARTLGARSDGTARFLHGGLGWAAVWSRALTSAEHLAVGASPGAIWQVYRPRHDTLFVFGSPAVQDPVGVASDTSTLCMAGP